MSLTLNERRKRVDTSLQNVFTRINLVNKDLGNSFNEVVERELLREDRLTEEGLVEELEAFHDYVLDKLEYQDIDKLYTSKSRGRRVAGGFEPVFTEPKTVEDVVAEVQANKEVAAEPAVPVKTEATVVEETEPAAVPVITTATSSLPAVAEPTGLPDIDSPVVEEELPATEANVFATVEEDNAPSTSEILKSAQDTVKITAEDILHKEFAENSKGYDLASVDKFLEEVAEFFKAEEPSRSQVIAQIKEIRDVEFPKSKMFQKGPDADEVDEYLDQLEAELRNRIA